MDGVAFFQAGQVGLEPTTARFGDGCSSKLSYWPVLFTWFLYVQYVFCKICNKRYSVKQLKSIKVGGGAKPFFIRQEKKKGIKRFFKKRRKPPTMYGGEGYTCPEDHNLISMITWKTF